MIKVKIERLLSTHEPLIRGALMGVGVFLALDFAVWAAWAVRGM